MGAGAQLTGYDRPQSGPARLDAGGNGCDTRNDMFNRDLTDITYVTSDPYTATIIAFLRGVGASDAEQIDQVVALSDAWQKGAQHFTYSQRVALANDPLNLQSTNGPTRQAFIDQTKVAPCVERILIIVFVGPSRVSLTELRPGPSCLPQGHELRDGS